MILSDSNLVTFDAKFRFETNIRSILPHKLKITTNNLTKNKTRDNTNGSRRSKTKKHHKTLSPL